MKGSVAVIVATAAIFAALTAYAWRGSSARYFRDDYCTALSTREHGPLGMMLDFRARWSGRFSYFFVKGLVETAGSWTPPFMPAAILAGFVAAGVFALRRLLDLPLQPALLVAAAGVFATFDASPEVLAVDGPLIWETGSLTYALPLILFVSWLALFAPGAAWRRRYVLSAVLMFFAGGLSETSLAAQGALTGGAVATCLVLRDRRRAAVAACGLVATIAALAIVWTAPGNAIRIYRSPETPSLVTAGLESLRIAGIFLGSQTLPYGWALLLVLVTGSILGSLSSRLRADAAFAVGLISLGAYVASFVPSAWILANTPPDRALLVSNFFLVVATGAFAAAFNSRRRGPRDLRVDYGTLLLLAIIPLFSAVRTARTIPEGRDIAAETGRIAAEVIAGRGRDVTVRSQWAVDTAFATPWPDDDVTRCVARFYGARSLRAIVPAADG